MYLAIHPSIVKMRVQYDKFRTFELAATGGLAGGLAYCTKRVLGWSWRRRGRRRGEGTTPIWRRCPRPFFTGFVATLAPSPANYRFQPCSPSSPYTILQLVWAKCLRGEGRAQGAGGRVCHLYGIASLYLLEVTSRRPSRVRAFIPEPETPA